MYLNKAITAENGAQVAHHRVVRVLLEMGGEHLQVLVHSWPTEQSRLDGYPELWRSHQLIALADLDLALGLREAVLAALCAPGSALEGATTSV